MPKFTSVPMPISASNLTFSLPALDTLSTLQRHLKRRRPENGAARAQGELGRTLGNRLVAVELARRENGNRGPACALKVVLGSGRRIEVGPDFDLDTFERLVKTLKALDPRLVGELKDSLPDSLFERLNGCLSTDQARLKFAEYKIRVLEERLRLIRIEKYGSGPPQPGSRIQKPPGVRRWICCRDFRPRDRRRSQEKSEE